MNTHIDTLTEWWENAEKGEAEPGDWIITHGPDDTNHAYIIEQAPRYPLSSKRQPYRILTRAPKPAWHDAVAVIASTDYCERQVWQRDTINEGWWYGTTGDGAVASDLRDVTPLTEATVTDEMVIRARGSLKRATGYDYAYAIVQDALTAALGLETA